MRRVDVDDGERNVEGEGKVEQGGTGEGAEEEEEKEKNEEKEEERRVFKTRTGAGTAVLKAGVMEERAKMSWFCDLGPAEEVFEISNFDDA